MKITPKFQRGGQFSSYFTVYTPLEVPQPSQKTVARSTTSSDDGKLTEKDLFDMIKDIDGLPNDMQSIVGNLLTTFQWNNLTGTNTSSLATTYLQNIYQIKLAKQNKEYYDEALKNAYTNGSLSEPAITASGELVVQKSDGSISSVPIETYMNNPDKLHPLTVSNLADMRKFDPQLVGNSTIFGIINTSIGFQNFQNLIKDAVKTLGTTEYSREGMFSNEGQASKGLDLLKTLIDDDRVQAIGSVTAEGLYKYKIIDKNQLNQINALTDYILDTLPNNAKTWAAFKLGKSDKDKATKELIVKYLTSGASISHAFDIDYEGSVDKVTGNKSKGDATTDDIVQNTATKWLRGLGVQNVFTINPGTNYATQVLANTLPLTDSDKKYLGANSVLQQATQGEYAGILDFNSASMGMQRIDPSNFGKIVLTDGKISSIDFPSKVLDDGTIVPDLSPQISEAKQAADREIKQLRIDLSSISSISANYKAINDIYTKHGLEPAYNPDGTPTNNWTRFGVINASASNNALGMDQFDSNELLQPINDDAVVDNLLQVTKEENYDTNNFLWNGVDHFYRGTVWVPVNVSYVAASANSGIKTDQLNNIINREAALNASKMLTKEKK